MLVKFKVTYYNNEMHEIYVEENGITSGETLDKAAEKLVSFYSERASDIQELRLMPLENVLLKEGIEQIVLEMKDVLHDANEERLNSDGEWEWIPS